MSFATALKKAIEANPDLAKKMVKTPTPGIPTMPSKAELDKENKILQLHKKNNFTTDTGKPLGSFMYVETDLNGRPSFVEKNGVNYVRVVTEPVQYGTGGKVVKNPVRKLVPAKQLDDAGILPRSFMARGEKPKLSENGFPLDKNGNEIKQSSLKELDKSKFILNRTKEPAKTSKTLPPLKTNPKPAPEQTAAQLDKVITPQVIDNVVANDIKTVMNGGKPTPNYGEPTTPAAQPLAPAPKQVLPEQKQMVQTPAQPVQQPAQPTQVQPVQVPIQITPQVVSNKAPAKTAPAQKAAPAASTQAANAVQQQIQPQNQSTLNTYQLLLDALRRRNATPTGLGTNVPSNPYATYLKAKQNNIVGRRS